MTATSSILDTLYETIEARRHASADSSYTASLFAKGSNKCAEKFGEEAVEAVIAAVSGDREGLIGEAADVLYHLLVVLADQNIKPDEIYTELSRRTAQSGLEEKAGRK